MCHADKEEKKKERDTMERIELPSQERIKISREKENNKYLGIL